MERKKFGPRVHQTNAGGPSVEQQKAGLRDAGVEVEGEHAPVYVDVVPSKRAHRPVGSAMLSARAKILRDLRPGSALVVYSLDRLGILAPDIRIVLDEMHDRGCPVKTVVKVTGDECDEVGSILTANTPRKLLTTAWVAAEAALNRERIGPARAAKIAWGIRGGSKGKPLSDDEMAAAKQDWLALENGLSAAEIVKRYGRSVSTLRRWFGSDRGTLPGCRKTRLRKENDNDQCTRDDRVPRRGVRAPRDTIVLKAPWHRVYDIAEGFHRRLADNDPERGKEFEDRLNDFFRENGIGWTMEDGHIVVRGSEMFTEASSQASRMMVQTGRHTAAGELHEALADLSRRPVAGITGAIRHAMAALECVARDISGQPNKTLGSLIGVLCLPKPLDSAVEKLWGFASEQGRHLREGRSPRFEDAELVVTVSSAVSVYLLRTSGNP